MLLMTELKDESQQYKIEQELSNLWGSAREVFEEAEKRHRLKYGEVATFHIRPKSFPLQNKIVGHLRQKFQKVTLPIDLQIFHRPENYRLGNLGQTAWAPETDVVSLTFRHVERGTLHDKVGYLVYSLHNVGYITDPWLYIEETPKWNGRIPRGIRTFRLDAPEVNLFLKSLDIVQKFNNIHQR